MEKKLTGSIVTKNGRLYARLRFTDDLGKKRDIWRAASSKKAAKEKIKALIEDSQTKTAKELDAARMTFNQLADFYEKTYLHEAIYINERKVSGIRNIKPNKYNLKLLRAHFGNRLIQTIQYSDLLQFKLKRLNTPLRDGTQRGIAGVNRLLQLLRRLFSISVQMGWIKKNPFRNGDSLISLADEPHRTRILSFDEEARLLAAINSEPLRFHLKGIVLIALDCGLRKNEILTLRRNDIDFISRTITIRAYNAKTSKSRKIGMTSRVEKWLRQYENFNAEDCIFPFVSFQTIWYKTLKKANIEGFHFHDCRATCISRLISAGLPHTEVMRISGHSTLSCLFRYIRSNDDSIAKAANALDDYLMRSLLANSKMEASEFIN